MAWVCTGVFIRNTESIILLKIWHLLSSRLSISHMFCVYCLLTSPLGLLGCLLCWCCCPPQRPQSPFCWPEIIVCFDFTVLLLAQWMWGLWLVWLLSSASDWLADQSALLLLADWAASLSLGDNYLFWQIQHHTLTPIHQQTTKEGKLPKNLKRWEKCWKMI